MRASANIVPLHQSQFSEKSPPRKPKNGDMRPREHLTDIEVADLIKSAQRGRHGHRDGTLILLMYRHGLRVSEAVVLRWDEIDLKSGLIQVRRAKQGLEGIHPLSGREIRHLRRLQRESGGKSPYVFVSERGTPMTTRNVRQILTKAGQTLPFPIHPHMLRHSCGYKLINDGIDVRTVQQYLGHASINSTVIYTKLDSRRFNGLWRD